MTDISHRVDHHHKYAGIVADLRPEDTSRPEAPSLRAHIDLERVPTARLEAWFPPAPMRSGPSLSPSMRLHDLRARPGIRDAHDPSVAAPEPSSTDHAAREASGRMAYWREHAGQFLVVPSIDYDIEEMQKVAGAERYEERQLFHLLLLNRPRTELVFVTSRAVDPSAVDYYLALKHGHLKSEDKARLRMIAVESRSNLPLSIELLLSTPTERAIVAALDAGTQLPAGLSVFTSSKYASRFAARIGLPLLAPRAAQLGWGTKSGSRDAFRRAGVPHPVGLPAAEDGDLLDERGYIAGDRELALGLARAVLREPEPRRLWMVKLNEGFSGEGNAILDLEPVLRSYSPEGREEAPALEPLTKAIREHFPRMRCAAGGSECWDTFREKIPRLGVIAEAFLDGAEIRPPSCQALIDEDGGVEILSTHEQRLGGPEGQLYLGCEFPARSDYRAELQRHTRAIGEVLAKEGVVGLFGVDYLATRSRVAEGTWALDALEINLRATGTTHPFLTLELLTEGRLTGDGRFLLSDGSERTYVADDNLQKPAYVGLTPTALTTAIRRSPLHWDPSRREGVVLHLFGTLERYGKIGYTAIARTLSEAERLREGLEALLDRLAENGSAATEVSR